MREVQAPRGPAGPRPILRLAGVSFVRDGRTILDRIDWLVAPGDRWVVLGPNGSGKTSLCRIASLHLHPSQGTVDVLGERFGRIDARALRARIGMTSQALADQMRPGLTAAEIVLTGRHAALAPGGTATTSRTMRAQRHCWPGSVAARWRRRATRHSRRASGSASCSPAR